MSVQQRLTAELTRRISVVTGEVEKWDALSQAADGDLTIHRRQIQAIVLMMQVLAARQRDAAAAVTSDLEPGPFSEKYVDALRVICGVDELWRVFDHILGQRRDPEGSAPLRALDLTAAGCYSDGIEQPIAWGVIAETERREPPLVMLDADISPAMVGRGGKVGLLGMPVSVFQEQRLPVPIVTLPFDQIHCLWLATAIHHEAGHVLDRDLRLSLELNGLLDARMNGTVPFERARFWGLWGHEILADAIGLLLGNAGYGINIASLSMVLAPRAPAFDEQDVHPHSALRTHLIVSLMRRLQIPSLTRRADALDQEWRQRGHPDWVNPFLADCDVVAEVYLAAPLAALRNHPLRQLVPGFAAECALTEQLALWLHTGFNRPSPDETPWRLVPAAAQLAVADAGSGGDAAIDAIDRKAREFLEEIPRPQWLATPAGNPDTWRAMAEGITF
jgi:hypothetical protein